MCIKIKLCTLFILILFLFCVGVFYEWVRTTEIVNMTIIFVLEFRMLFSSDFVYLFWHRKNKSRDMNKSQWYLNSIENEMLKLIHIWEFSWKISAFRMLFVYEPINHNDDSYIHMMVWDCTFQYYIFSSWNFSSQEIASYHCKTSYKYNCELKKNFFSNVQDELKKRNKICLR